MPTPTPRLIRLRRPAVIVASGERFVPASMPLERVDEAWREACAANPRLFDGPLWHVHGVSRNGHGGVTIHAIESSYRFHAVRALGVETGVRPLGVKALTHRGDRVLLGRRSEQVHAEPLRWEFVPGGTLAPGVEPEAQVEAELREECGWRCDAPPTQIALLFDDRTHTWEIVHRAAASPTTEPDGGRAATTPSWEHDRLAEVRPEEAWSRELTHAATLMLALLDEPAPRGTGRP